MSELFLFGSRESKEMRARDFMERASRISGDRARDMVRARGDSPVR